MSSTLLVISLLASLLALWVSLLRLPSWFFRSLHRHRLWRERDAIADEILSGLLPKEHPAVQELLAVADHTARDGHQMSVLDLYLWRAVGHRCDLSAIDALSEQLAGLSEREQALLLRHRERVGFLATSSTLLGSWLGIAMILHRVVPAMREVRRRRRASCEPAREASVEPLRATLVEATTEATQSPIGRAAREFINLQDGIVAASSSGGPVNGRPQVLA